MTDKNTIYENYLSGRQQIQHDTVESVFNPRKKYLSHIIKKYFPENKVLKIVDLGCGSGAFIHFLQQYNYTNTEGFDISKEQVDLAHKLGLPNVTQSDLIFALKEFNDNTIDVIIAFDVLEHFKKGQIEEFTALVKQKLKPEGLWFIHVPNAESPYFGRIRYGDYTHEMAFTRESITQLLTSKNFEVIELVEEQPVAQGLFGITRFILWKIIRLVHRFHILVETGYSCKDCIFSQNFLCIAKNK